MMFLEEKRVAKNTPDHPGELFKEGEGGGAG